MADINIGQALKEKMGPLPTWVWMLAMGGAAVAYYLYERRKNADKKQDQQGGVNPTQSLSSIEGAQFIPDYVFQNYNYIPAAAPGPAGPTGPAGPSGPAGPTGPTGPAAPKPEPAKYPGNPRPTASVAYTTHSGDTWSSILAAKGWQGLTNPAALKQWNSTHSVIGVGSHGRTESNKAASGYATFGVGTVIALPSGPPGFL